MVLDKKDLKNSSFFNLKYSATFVFYIKLLFDKLSKAEMLEQLF